MTAMDLLRTERLFSLSHTIAAALFETAVYPWEILTQIGAFIPARGEALDDRFTRRAGNIWIAKTATVAPTASISGPCIIDEYAEIRHCAFIRGNAVVGKRCVVGNSTELKNAILFDGAQAPHFNYVGDSVLGRRAHMGAGAITSNVKSDKTNVTIRFGAGKIETGLRKFGAMLADDVEIGSGSVLCPGAVIGKGAIIYPLSRVRGFIGADRIFKSAGDIVEKTVREV